MNLQEKKDVRGVVKKIILTISKLIGEDIYKFISIDSSVHSRDSYGGTSRKNVKRMIPKYKKILSKL